MRKYIAGTLDKYDDLIRRYYANINLDLLNKSPTLIDTAPLTKTAGKVIQVCPKEEDFQYHRARCLSAGNVIDHSNGTCELVPFEVYSKDLAKYSKLCRNANDNGDFFSHEELTNDFSCEAAKGKKLDYTKLNGTFETLRGKSIFVNHMNENVEDARGIILDVVYNPNRYFVEILFAIDKKAFPELAKSLRTRMITDVSMGCTVERSICSICGNVCTTEDNICDHISNYKGYTMNFNGENLPVMEYNIRPSFFETSIVTTGADPDAKILSRVASLKQTVKNSNVYLKTKNDYLIHEKNQRFANGRTKSIAEQLKTLPWS